MGVETVVLVTRDVSKAKETNIMLLIYILTNL